MFIRCWESFIWAQHLGSGDETIFQKIHLCPKIFALMFWFLGASHKYPTCMTCLSTSFSILKDFRTVVWKQFNEGDGEWIPSLETPEMKWVAWFVVNLPFGAHLGWRSFNLGRFSSSVKKMCIMYTCVYAIFCIYTSDCSLFRGISLPNHEGLPLLKSRILVILWSTFQGAEK